jgi:hypothetical protein
MGVARPPAVAPDARGMLAAPPPPVDPFVNGSFEQTYTGWTLASDSGLATTGAWGIASSGTTLSTGQTVHDYQGNLDLAPGCLSLGPFQVIATNGSFAAFNTQTSADRHRMWQDLALPAAAKTLSWSMAYQSAGPFDLTSEYLAVQIRSTNDAVLSTVFVTNPATAPLGQPMASFTVPISQYAGQTVRVTVDVQVRTYCLFAVFDDFHIGF